MAIRNIRTIGDSVLGKRAKEVLAMDDKLKLLIVAIILTSLLLFVEISP